MGGMKAVAIRWAEQEAARKARKRPVRLVMWRQAAQGRRDGKTAEKKAEAQSAPKRRGPSRPTGPTVTT